MKVQPEKSEPNKGRALAMKRWLHETPDPLYFSKIAKLRWKEWRNRKRKKILTFKKGLS